MTLVRPGGGASPAIRRTVDGAVTWERSLDEVVGTGVSPGSQVQWRTTLVDDRMFVQGYATVPGAPDSPIDPTTGTALTILDVSTGVTAWHEIGADLCPFGTHCSSDKRRSVIPICRYTADTREHAER